MQFIKEKFKNLQKKSFSSKEIIMIYGVLGVILLGSIYQLMSMGYSPNTLLIAHVMPQKYEQSVGKKLLLKWAYTLTGIKWDQPDTYLMSVTPYRRMIYEKKVAAGEVKGYFEQDENTYLVENEAENYVPQVPNRLEQEDYTVFKDTSYVYNHFFTAPSKMEFGLDMFEKWNFYDLVTQPISIHTEETGPKILIFHTHAREEYVGGLTVVDIGETLAETMESQYGIEVLHVTDAFYESSNFGNRPTGGEYERMEPVIEKILAAYPSISVVIDLHRDGVNEGVHLVSEQEGKQMAKIMFVNGLCLNRNIAGEVEEKVDLPNPYIGDNLAFSLQMVVNMNQMYPGLSRKIYLNEWRYSTHMKPNSLLLEWGAQTNTSEEAMNSVGPVAEILAKVLQKD